MRAKGKFKHLSSLIILHFILHWLLSWDKIPESCSGLRVVISEAILLQHRSEKEGRERERGREQRKTEHALPPPKPGDQDILDPTPKTCL